MIGASVTSCQVLSALTVPFSTGTSMPGVTLALLSASLQRVHAPPATTRYRPLSLAAAWFFTSTRAPADNATPSTVCKPLRVMAAVVATSTECLKSCLANSSVTHSRVASTTLGSILSCTLLALLTIRFIRTTWVRPEP
ncbi:hypothetical protein D3C77_335720 [compost metagenome]